MYKKTILALAVVLIAGGAVGLYIHFKKSEVPVFMPKVLDKGQAAAENDLQKKMIGRGEAVMVERRYQAVIAVYEGMLKKSPDDAAIRKKLADTYFKLGNYQLENGKEADAEKSFVRAKELQ